MAKLILMRHFKSQWNLENRFTGWVNVPLAKERNNNIKSVVKKVLSFKIDKIYTSPLFRNLATVSKLFENSKKYPVFVYLDKGKMRSWGNYAEKGSNQILVFVSENLNERYYGKLQGLNKDEVTKKYGKEKVRLWRRSYNVAPPGGESLKMVFKRTTSFYKKFIEKDLKEKKNILIVASHNSLRAIVKYIEKISDQDIIDIEIPYAGLKIYEY